MKTLIRIGLLALAHVSFAADTTETLPIGGIVSLMASADGNPAPTFQWKKDGVAIDGATNALLSLGVLNISHAGAYTVTATNEVGSATSDKYILIIDDRTPPAIAMAPLDARVIEGSSVTLSVVATGNPAPTYQWRKNGIEIPGATLSKLTFAAISRTDAGSYTATATNEKGAVTSSAATITVLYGPSAPIITRPISNAVVPKKTNVLFKIEAVGEDLAYQWKKGNSNLAGKTGTELLLTTVNPADEGTYTVTVRNPYGSGTSSARLTVLR